MDQSVSICEVNKPMCFFARRRKIINPLVKNICMAVARLSDRLGNTRKISNDFAI